MKQSRNIVNISSNPNPKGAAPPTQDATLPDDDSENGEKVCFQGFPGYKKIK